MKATICEGKVFHLGECKWVAQVVNLTILAACGKLQAQTFMTWVNSESFWFLKPHSLRTTAESFWGTGIYVVEAFRDSTVAKKQEAKSSEIASLTLGFFANPFSLLVLPT